MGIYFNRIIRANYTNETIRVYQAYNDTIADECIKLGTFGSSFSITRMTWIKPSFLWMMYRSGWGTKKNQNRILAFDIKIEGFIKLLKKGKLSHYDKFLHHSSREDYLKEVKKSDVVVQWDPDKDINLEKLEKRAIQIGLRGDTLLDYILNYIVNIEDITEEVKRLKVKIDEGLDVTNELPNERDFLLNDFNLKEKLGIVEYEYSQNVITGIILNKKLEWYICDREFWFMDRKKYLGSSRDYKKWFGIEVTNTDTAEEFLNSLNEFKVDTIDIIDRNKSYIKRYEGDSLYYTANFPDFLINFDSCIFYDCFPEPNIFHKCIPSDWYLINNCKEVESSINNLVPKCMKFWSNNK